MPFITEELWRVTAEAGPARAGLLARHGDAAGADEAYARAIGLEGDPAVRRFLAKRRAALSATSR